jgi:hypothetical protein
MTDDPERKTAERLGEVINPELGFFGCCLALLGFGRCFLGPPHPLIVCALAIVSVAGGRDGLGTDSALNLWAVGSFVHPLQLGLYPASADDDRRRAPPEQPAADDVVPRHRRVERKSVATNAQSVNSRFRRGNWYNFGTPIDCGGQRESQTCGPPLIAKASAF